MPAAAGSEQDRGGGRDASPRYATSVRAARPYRCRCNGDVGGARRRRWRAGKRRRQPPPVGPAVLDDPRHGMRARRAAAAGRQGARSEGGRGRAPRCGVRCASMHAGGGSGSGRP